MKSVISNEYTTIIKNSKFICLIYPIESISDVETYLEGAKRIYPNATHYCYAYILNTIRRESDDGEPSGTAGIPMIQVLEKNNLNQVLCIVIRYFGKIKLGANGLIRAYTKCVTACLENHIITLSKGLLIELTFPYSAVKNVDYLLQSSKILKKEFNNLITYRVLITEEILNKLKNINKDIKIKIIKETFFSLSQ